MQFAALVGVFNEGQMIHFQKWLSHMADKLMPLSARSSVWHVGKVSSPRGSLHRAAWASCSLAARFQKWVFLFQKTGGESSQSLKAWVQKLVHHLFSCILFVKVVTKPTILNGETSTNSRPSLVYHTTGCHGLEFTVITDKIISKI